MGLGVGKVTGTLGIVVGYCKNGNTCFSIVRVCFPLKCEDLQLGMGMGDFLLVRNDDFIEYDFSGVIGGIGVCVDFLVASCTVKYTIHLG